MEDLYTAESIQVLSQVQAIRRRPGMYVGGTGSEARHHLVWEVIGNAIDEALRGHATTVRVTFDDTRVTVEDDGRGIPLDVVQRALTQFTPHGYHGPDYRRPHVHLGTALHGVGLVVTGALSSELDVTVRRDGREYVQRFTAGVALGPIADRGPTVAKGTRLSFVPDAAIFEPSCEWDLDEVERRCRQLAALIPDLTIIVDDRELCYEHGLPEYVQDLAEDQTLLEPLHIVTERDGIGVELALAWVAPGSGGACSFVNYADTRGGVHMRGLFRGIHDVLGKLVGSVPSKLREQIAHRLIAILHVQLDHPRFGNPTHDWLENREVERAVRSTTRRELARHFERAPALLDQILLDLEPKTRRRGRRSRQRTR